MGDDRYIELLLKEADGLITDLENRELHRWLESSPEHKQRAEKTRKAYAGSRVPLQVVEVNLSQEFEKVQEKIKKSHTIPRSYQLRPWQIAAGLLLLIAASWWILAVIRSPVSNLQVYTGPRENLILSDGSVVFLAINSHFQFDDTEKTRQGTLRGKAYFEIKTDPKKPFEIKTDLGKVTVLGTAFEIDVSSESAMIVKVSQGSIQLTSNNSETLVLQQGETGFVSSTVLRKTDYLLPAGAWRLSPITFDQAVLDELLREIEDKYQIQLTTEDSSLRQCKINFTLSYPELPALIDMLETLLSVSINQTGATQYSINGEGCQ